MEPKFEHDTQQRIRMKAYELWLLEGRPEGREARHWQMAKEFIAREETRSTLLAINREDDGASEPLDQPPAKVKAPRSAKAPNNRAA